MGGVCIILSPTFDLAHKKSGKETITIPASEGENFEGRFIGIPLTFPNTDDNGKNIKGELNITLCSIYHPVDNEEYESFNSTLSSILNHIPQKSNIILGHDINANTGTNANNGQNFKDTIGPFGIENRNKKGTSLLNLLASLNLKVTNSYFNPRPSNRTATSTHTTWRNTSASKSQHMLDVFSCSNTLFKRVQGCNTTSKGTESDHTAVVLKIHINTLSFKMQNKKLITETDWEKIMGDEATNITYNETLKNLNELTATDDNTPTEYTNFFKNVKRAGEQTATKVITPPLDWFEMSKEKTQPRIDVVNAIRKQLRECKDEQTINRLKKELKMANKIRNIVIAEAKEHYMSKLAKKIARLAGTNSNAAWKAVRECELGNKFSHRTTAHTQPIPSTRTK